MIGSWAGGSFRGSVNALVFIIGRDFVNIVRTKPIPILVRWWVFMIVMAEPPESEGLAITIMKQNSGTGPRPSILTSSARFARYKPR